MIRKAIQPMIGQNTDVIGAAFVSDFCGEIKKAAATRPTDG